ncbi:unnamed protein product [Chironomus riparius]|uniref:Uncharacterized protein n=1 Tax=Chironomus riparius TaxID=315576 RepID=A0A9N9WLF0_9DIPT|nr:unnamed protein product [Chironomus riparius]
MARKKRARSRNFSQQVCNKMKRAKGEEYKSRNGEIKSAKVFQHVDCGCGLKCFLRVSFDERKALFEEFHKIGDVTNQKLFILGMTTLQEIVRKQGKNIRKRTGNVLYVLRSVIPDSTLKEKVCLTFFSNTFMVNTRTIQRWSKIRQPSKLIHQNRGKPSSRKIDYPDVMEFINSYELYESHYCRAKHENKKYLPPNYTIRRFYEDYTSHCNLKGKVPTVTEEKFYDIIQYETEISIHVPLQDTCASCDKLKVQIQHAKDAGKRNKLNAQKKEHLTDVDIVKHQFDLDKEKADDEYFVYTFDLQKMLVLPILSTSVAYYKRNFNLYNLGVHPFPKNEDTSMFVWSEVEGSKGAEEIPSCLIKFLKEHAASASHIVSYSDRAGGQNRNIKIVLAFLRLLADPTMKVETIDLKYLISGHSRLPNDRDFALIERKIKQHSAIFLPSHYIDIIKSARNESFKVYSMTREDFRTTKELEGSITNRRISKSKTVVNWMNFAWIRLEKDHPFQIKFKKNFMDEDFSIIDITKRGNNLKNLFEVIPSLLYPNERRITAAKKKDLLDLLPYIPVEYHNFYENLGSLDNDEE